MDKPILQVLDGGLDALFVCRILGSLYEFDTWSYCMSSGSVTSHLKYRYLEKPQKILKFKLDKYKVLYI